MNGYVTVRYRLTNICAPRDLVDTGKTFEQMVRYLIAEEGVLGIADDVAGEIVSVEEIR